MNLSRFIALRIYRNSEPGKQVSRPAVLIAMVGIALGLAVMIIAVSVIVELCIYVVPNLHVSVTVTAYSTARLTAAILLASVIVNL